MKKQTWAVLTTELWEEVTAESCTLHNGALVFTNDTGSSTLLGDDVVIAFAAGEWKRLMSVSDPEVTP